MVKKLAFFANYQPINQLSQLSQYLLVQEFSSKYKSCSARQAGHFKLCFEYLAHTVQKLKIWPN